MSEAIPLRKIPSVSEVLQHLAGQAWSQEYSRNQLVGAVRSELSDLRYRVKKEPSGLFPDLDHLIIRIQERLQTGHAYSLKMVINASGVIIHTNLGRAPIAADGLARICEIAGGYSNLEFDLEAGSRGSRDQHLDKLFRQILGGEASLVVNNNAAALLLALNSLAEGKEVIVSRGELVEIGGSFRLPEIMKKSGAILREVGTTNKTRLEDYQMALHGNSGLILIVHPSNFQIIGFTEKPSLQELVALGKQNNIPVLEDHGSGILIDLAQFGISNEPQVSSRLQAGVDLICFSGDKILGGPQAGVICGKKAWIDQLRKNPLFRALRVDKMIYAAMEATLLLYLKNRFSCIPALSMLSQTEQDLKARGQMWLTELRKQFPETTWGMESTLNYVGGGVAPMKSLPSAAIAFRHPEISAEEIVRRLRQSEPPVIARIENQQILFELRTITVAEQEMIASALHSIFVAPARLSENLL